MAEFRSIAKRTLLALYLTVIHLALISLLLDKYVIQKNLVTGWNPVQVEGSPVKTDVTAVPLPSQNASPVASQSPASDIPPVHSPALRVIIPVEGVSAEQLIDTFSESRSEGARNHDAIDIPAPLGTPVLAAVDGEIVKFHDGEQGGITIYQISSNKKYFFYYAHLQRRADGIAERQFVKKGTTIGYVGDSGNAGTGNYHLHFSISAVIEPKRYWEGISVNPYKVLKGEAELQ